MLSDSARKANLIKTLEKKRKIIDNQSAVSTHIWTEITAVVMRIF